MTRIMRSLVGTLALLAFALPAGADPGASTHVDDVVTAVDGSTITVTGSATFVDVPVVVSEDPAGDAVAGGIGLDVTDVTFSRPNPASQTLRLEADVADQTDQVFGAPTTLYHFPITVNGQMGSCAGGPGFWFPEARIASANPPGATPSFRLMCDLSPGGVATGPTISGSIGDGVVWWQFSMFQIGATAGDTLSHGGDCVDPGTTTSPPGVSWICNNATGDGVFLDDYEIPGATVSLGVVTSDTPDSIAPLTASASVNASDGSFAAVLPTPGEPGEYKVVAEACYGSSNCSRSAGEAFSV